MPQRGRETTFRYLVKAKTVLGDPGVRYVGEWHSATGAVLELATEVEGIVIDGVGMIALSE